MTLVILGLDALDTAHIGNFGMDEVQLRSHGEMETFSYMLDRPHTGEVWPTIATGLHPREHGITGSTEAEWDSYLVEFASKFTGHLQFTTRNKLGNLANSLLGASWELAETDCESFLNAPNRACHNWPGVYRSSELERLWKTLEIVNDNGMSREEFDRTLYGEAAEKFGWVTEMLRHDTEIVATHIHLVDLAGHVYGSDRDHYETFYDWTNRKVREVKEQMSDDDELLILSDHGMKTTWTDPDDENAPEHSFRAFSASTLDSRPEDVFDVRDWVESHVQGVESSSDQVDLPEEQLRELGYIE